MPYPNEFGEELKIADSLRIFDTISVWTSQRAHHRKLLGHGLCVGINRSGTPKYFLIASQCHLIRLEYGVRIELNEEIAEELRRVDDEIARENEIKKAEAITSLLEEKRVIVKKIIIRAWISAALWPTGIASALLIGGLSGLAWGLFLGLAAAPLLYYILDVPYLCRELYWLNVMCSLGKENSRKLPQTTS